jgi:COP9 signalosome complex subunit 1
VPFCIEALKNAVNEAKAGTDVGRYKDAWDLIRVAAPGEPEAILDQDWIDRTERENANELHRLDSELKGYRNNLIKESIRVSDACQAAT